jgi:ribonuclease D
MTLTKLNKDLQQQNKVRKLLKEMKAFMNFFEGFTNRYRLQPKQQNEEFDQPASSQEQVSEISVDDSQNLFFILKQIRRQFAGEENVPPFQICHDSTLNEIVAFLPQTINDMAMIKGMGDHRLKNYGDQFLSAVQSFVQQTTWPVKCREEASKGQGRKKNRKAVLTHSKSLHLFDQEDNFRNCLHKKPCVRHHRGARCTIRKGNLDVFSFSRR